MKRGIISTETLFLFYFPVYFDNVIIVTFICI